MTKIQRLCWLTAECTEPILLAGQRWDSHTERTDYKMDRSFGSSESRGPAPFRQVSMSPEHTQNMHSLLHSYLIVYLQSA